jgi:hypothetical protein
VLTEQIPLRDSPTPPTDKIQQEMQQWECILMTRYSMKSSYAAGHFARAIELPTTHCNTVLTLSRTVLVEYFAVDLELSSV